MAFDDKTDEELQEELRAWHREARTATAMVTAIMTELLKRRKAELTSGGHYTDWGFVPDRDP